MQKKYQNGLCSDEQERKKRERGKEDMTLCCKVCLFMFYLFMTFK